MERKEYNKAIKYGMELSAWDLLYIERIILEGRHETEYTGNKILKRIKRLKESA
jgi:hypothetical protein